METVNDIRKFYSDKERTVIDYTANMNTYSSPTNGVVVNTLNQGSLCKSKILF